MKTKFKYLQIFYNKKIKRSDWLKIIFCKKEKKFNLVLFFSNSIKSLIRKKKVFENIPIRLTIMFRHILCFFFSIRKDFNVLLISIWIIRKTIFIHLFAKKKNCLIFNSWNMFIFLWSFCKIKVELNFSFPNPGIFIRCKTKNQLSKYEKTKLYFVPICWWFYVFFLWLWGRIQTKKCF